MNDYKIKFIIVLFAIVYISISLLIGNPLSIHPYSKAYGQLSLPSSTTTTIKITKHMINSYTISSDSSSIDTFGTNYTILGNKDSIKKEQKLVTSTIKDDFNKSPIIGYVKASAKTTTSPAVATLPNPFADKTTINQKIETEINNALSSTVNTNFAKISIQCDFGMNLPDWKCKSHGLLG